MLIHIVSILLAAAALGATLLAVGYLALRNSTGMVALVLAVWIVSFALRDSVDLSVTVSGVQIFALDVLFVVMAVIGVGRALSHGIRGIGGGLALLLLFLLTVHIARGIGDVGVQTAVVDARGWIYFTAALVYAATVSGGWDRGVWKLLAGAGVLVAVIAVPYLLVDGLGPAGEQFYRNGQWVSVRPITAAGTLLVLQAAILAPALGWPSRRAAVWVMLAAGTVALLLMHRTVWVAGLLIGVVGFLWWSARRGREAESTVLAATGVVVLVLPLAVWGFAQTGPLVASAKEATSSDSTFTWRTDTWQELLSSQDSALGAAVGRPPGSWTKLAGGRVVDASPHDGFIEAYLRFGLPGVIAYCWLGLLLWFRRAGVASATGLTPAAVGLVILTQLVFSITYTLDPVQGLIAGILVSGLLASSPARVAVRSRSTTRPLEGAVASR